MAKENYHEEIKRINLLVTLNMVISVVTIILVTVGIVCFIDTGDNSSYDVSMMRSLTVEDTLELFESSDTYVLYIGRESCDVCNDLLPVLQTVQVNNNYITQYLDISEVDRSLDNWQELVELLDVEVSSPAGDDEVNTFGHYLNSKGYTPCVIIISNGEMVAGFFGDKTESSLGDWLNSYGI